MTEQVKKAWLISIGGWSALILFLTGTYILYDFAMPPAQQINNHPAWALQEWGIWYLITPVIFRLLDHYHAKQQLTQKRFIGILALMLCISMTYQSIFDLFVFNDSIAYTLLYFAPSHPLVLFVISFIWHTYLRAEHTADSSIEVEQGAKKSQLCYSDITHINSASNYVEFHTQKQQFLKRTTLKQVEQQLPDSQFIRTHRSHLVNLDFIERIQIKPSGSGLVLLKNGQSVALSKAFKPKVKARLKNAA
ncbi:LytTR family transcriptional regulator [Pseudoalteromonas luteoviolacea]|uniref:LytR/AlgR family response regulator transcription factor n=1 Tax=Pseudoalteromonas luteoviolacea TaxID=43657 RepID=UPI001B386BD5|nr:LytTR family DNA-binding domain-containing protein [Pseudoalteromonas luteoviolacea]MBQ4812687.1 LytTR family transcriptional regulator [Pseudoalteromonas luteoviolacea]